MSYSFNYCASGVFVHISFANDSNDGSSYERAWEKVLLPKSICTPSYISVGTPTITL
jgi:hypothetical protein